MPVLVRGTSADYARAERLFKAIEDEILRLPREERVSFARRFSEQHPEVGAFLRDIMVRRGLI